MSVFGRLEVLCNRHFAVDAPLDAAEAGRIVGEDISRAAKMTTNPASSRMMPVFELTGVLLEGASAVTPALASIALSELGAPLELEVDEGICLIGP